MHQLELLARHGAPGFDPSFSEVRRTVLAHGAWIDHVAGWITGHDQVFDELERGLVWRHETRKMYDRTLPVPRLLAAIDDEGPGQPFVGQIRAALSMRYGESFVRMSAALYRDGADSVAWHGDTIARDLPEALVATISLGAPRRFLVKPTGGGASVAFRAGLGDLIVMGGTAQRTWRHSIPKVAHAQPRIAVMFRPAWAAKYR